MMVSGTIDSPVIKIPQTTIVVKKNFTEGMKEVKFNASMEKPVSKHVKYRYLFIIWIKSTIIIFY